MLFLHQGNRIEHLADQLGDLLESPSAPLVPEVVAVQSVGMARWLALLVAQRFGIAANLQFPFPGVLLWRLFRAMLPDVPERSPFSVEVLTWRMVAQLSDVAADPAFAPLVDYLGDGDDLRRYQLAERIALLFDQYLVYRPEWIAAWEDGKADHWQARLWRRMTGGEPVRHRVRLAREFVARLRSHPSPPATLPGRVSLFGLTSLPPAHLGLFAEIARVVDVHLFFLNPCREYWGGIRDARSVARNAVAEEPERLYLETGNSLLASLGRQGRDFFDALQDLDTDQDEAFDDPGNGCLLHAIQSDILNLRNRGETVENRTPWSPADGSIRIHSCHSPAREIEVLHDQLLDLFSAHPGLTPADVVVMIPDIDAYAPTIDAVFGAARPGRRIPYHVASGISHAAFPVMRAFFALLDVPDGRFEVNDVLALLEAPPIRRRFGMAEGDVDRVREWLRATGVRWGADAEDRAARDLPAVADHTWRAGLDRLLLGYALAGGGTRLFAGILPYDDVEGDGVAVVGRLAGFSEALFAAAADLKAPRSVPAWVSRLRALIADFFDPSDAEESERERLLAALASLEEHASQAGCTAEVSLRVVRSCLRSMVDAEGGRTPLASGTVTFCGMVPVRGIPFQAVCLVGMNDGAFPRIQRAPGFDLMQDAPRPGDRSRRQDDRALFLEALLAARLVFYLSYVGQDIRENTPLPPSVVVNEILDYVDRGFTGPDARRPMRDQLVIAHPLHAFSARYFRDGRRVFSYASELCDAGRVAAGERREPPPFLRQPLPQASAEWRQVEVNQLVRFVSHPARYLVRERLGIHLEEDEGLLEAREPFTLGPLSRYQLRQTLLDGRLRGEAAADLRSAVRAGGLLPHGVVGDILLQQETEDVECFARRVMAQRPAEPVEILPVDLDLGAIRLYGSLADCSTQGRFIARLGKTRVKDRISLWIHHLLLNRVGPPGWLRESRWVGEEDEIRLTPVADAEERLRRLAELYWAGLSQAIALLPESSYAYAAKLHGHEDRRAALAAARRAWEINQYTGQGEAADPYHRLVFRGSDPLDAAFEASAQAVFLPLLAHQEER